MNKSQFTPEALEFYAKKKEILIKHAKDSFPIIDYDFHKNPFFKLKLVETKNATFDDSLPLLKKFMDTISQEKKANIAVGGYLEDRKIYLKSEVFTQNLTPRTIHLGVDIWAEASTPIFAPLDAKVHSFQHNNNFGDYGGTLILEHTLDNEKFYTLYGHISLNSFADKYEGLSIKKGEKIAEIGTPKENGNWATHLHFQIILDILERKGDFIGVSSKEEIVFFQVLCPDPDILLKIPWELAL